MTGFELLLRDVSGVFPIVFAIEAGRYLLTAGLITIVVWAFWQVHFRSRKIQTRVPGARDYLREVVASLRSPSFSPSSGSPCISRTRRAG